MVSFGWGWGWGWGCGWHQFERPGGGVEVRQCLHRGLLLSSRPRLRRRRWSRAGLGEGRQDPLRRFQLRRHHPCRRRSPSGTELASSLLVVAAFNSLLLLLLFKSICNQIDCFSSWYYELLLELLNNSDPYFENITRTPSVWLIDWFLKCCLMTFQLRMKLILFYLTPCLWKESKLQAVIRSVRCEPWERISSSIWCKCQTNMFNCLY